MILVTGQGDLAFNAKGHIIGAMPLQGKIAYHLFKVDRDNSKNSYSVNLVRKSKWHPRYGNSLSKDIEFFWSFNCINALANCVSSIDFDYDGKFAATFDSDGVFLLSDVNTDNYQTHVKIGSREGS